MKSETDIVPKEKDFGIYHDLEINAPIEKVFAAITEPGLLINWWPLRCTGSPELHAEYNFYFGPDYNWFGIVHKIEKNKSFHIKMTKSDLDWEPTIFGFEIEYYPKSVLLHFTHLGWIKRNSHFRIASFCWAMLLKGLKDYVEKGIVIPFENRS